MTDRSKRMKKFLKTKDGVSYLIYQAQKRNSKKRGHRPPEYDLSELREWLYSQTAFHTLFKEWEVSGYEKDLKPSVDRKYNDLHYCFNNIQLMTWYENNELGRQSKMKPVKGVHKKTGEVVEFDSVKEAKETLGIKGIDNCLIGRAKTAGKYAWTYKEI